MNLGIDSSRNLIPLGGVLAATVLQVLAATRYPGGYDWFDQTLSALFQPTALNDAPNASRPLAILAVLTFCASIAIAFNMVARKGPSRFHRKTIQIAGIASMVYTALVVTPMHDVLIGIALLFFVIAMFTIFHWLFVERRGPGPIE